MESIRIIDLLPAGSYIDDRQTALIGAEGETLSYAQLRENVDRISEDLRARGIRKNQRIATVLTRGTDMTLAFLAITNTAVFIPLSPDYSAEQYHYYFKLFKAEALLITEQMESCGEQIAEALGMTVYYLGRRQTAEGIAYLLTGGENTKCKQLSWPQDQDTALIQFTSGTTAEPKVVLRSHRNLYYSTRQRMEEMGLTAAESVMITAPPYRGIFLTDTLTVLAAGGTAVYTDRFDPAQFFALAAKTSPAWMLGSPVVFFALADYAEQHHIEYHSDKLKWIRTAGAPLTQELRRRLQAIFNVPVHEGYGLTECGNIACSMNGPQGYKAGSVGVPVGIEVVIMNEKGERAGAEQSGEIWVRGPQVIEAYENNEGGDVFYQDWFRTGDRGYLDQDGYLFVAGRYKEIINRGGEKISPYEIEAVISRHPEIVQAAVFPIPMGGGNEEAGAAVVLKAGATFYLKDLRRFLNGKVTAFKIPTVLYVLSAIPTSDAGKIQRKKLYQSIVAEGITPQAEADENEILIMPRNDIENLLYDIFKKIVPAEMISVTDTFFELGGDSLKTAELFKQIKENFAVQVPLKYIFSNGSIEDLGRYISGVQANNKRHPFIMPFQENGSKTPIFFIHSAEGDAVMYRHVIMDFDPERPAYGINFDPHGAEWVHPITLEQIARQYIKDMITIQPQGPYILAAQCVGGLIACEMARQLLEDRQEIALLAVFDSIVPEAEIKDSIKDRLLRNIDELKTNGLFQQLKIKWYYYQRSFYWKMPGPIKKMVFQRMDKRNIIGCARAYYRMKKYDGEIVYFKPDYYHHDSLSSIELWRRMARQVRVVVTHGDHVSVFHAENADYTRQALEEVLADIP